MDSYWTRLFNADSKPIWQDVALYEHFFKPFYIPEPLLSCVWVPWYLYRQFSQLSVPYTMIKVNIRATYAQYKFYLPVITQIVCENLAGSYV